MKEKEITVILPIHKWDENYKEMFLTAFKSVEEFYNDVNLIIVSTPTIISEISNLNLITNLSVLKISNKEKTNFCSQVNLGLSSCKTKWFSILEIDDVYRKNWLKEMNNYILKYQNVDVFLPIVEDNNTNGEFLSYTNESVWAYGFSETQGFLDNEILLDFQNYQLSGGLLKTELFKEDVFLKDNIKLTFNYELLLRLTHNEKKIMVIPKVLYNHINFREDSLFWNYKNGEDKLSEKEFEFWFNTAKHEFFFNQKREINFVE
jgi:hypothetical protein